MASELRQRPASLRDGGPEMPTPSPLPPKKSGGCPVQVKSGTYYWVRKAVVILFPAYVLCCMFEFLEPPKPLIEHAIDDAREFLGMGPRVFSAAELKAKGVGSRPLLSILGEVYDVSKGAKHYGKGGAYEGFAGKDASRSFVSGDFTEAGLVDDVSGLEPSQCLGIKDWRDFYRNDAKYRQRGVLAGRFYDGKGNPTGALAAFERCAEEGQREKEREAVEKELYPGCNSRWAAAEGGRVWCEDPKKVPRKFARKVVHGADIRSRGPREGATKPEAGRANDEGGAATAGAAAAAAAVAAETSRDAGKAKGRCACFDKDFAAANQDRLLSYAGCAPDANLCITKPPEPAAPRKRK